MSELTTHYPDPPMSLEGLLSATRCIVEQDLKPLTVQIDLDGHYPQTVLGKLGAIGAFNPHLPASRADGLTDMGAAIQAMGAVSYECMSTGFTIWCQDTCGWYLQNAANPTLRDNWLPKVASGQVLAGTGMVKTAVGPGWAGRPRSSPPGAPGSTSSV